MTRGAIILCGGQSLRMGRDKNWLPFGSQETMLQRVVRLTSAAVPVEQIVCVAAPDQSLPTLPHGVQIVHDAKPHDGPLAGLATGLKSLDGGAEAIFAVGCDAPLVMPAFIARMFDLLSDHQVAAPCDGERWHPLAAVYRTSLLPKIESLLSAGRRSLIALLEASDTRRVSPEEFRDLDPRRISLIACNTPADYEFILANYIIGESN